MNIKTQKNSLNMNPACSVSLGIRAARYFACESHAHLVSKAGPVISRKSPSAVFKWSGI